MLENCVQARCLLPLQMSHGLGIFATYIATQRVAQRPDTVRCDTLRCSLVSPSVQCVEVCAQLCSARLSEWNACSENSIINRIVTLSVPRRQLRPVIFSTEKPHVTQKDRSCLIPPCASHLSTPLLLCSKLYKSQCSSPALLISSRPLPAFASTLTAPIALHIDNPRTQRSLYIV